MNNVGYQIIEKLHEGMFISVYRAIRSPEATEVIMKMANPDRRSPIVEERLHREHEMTQILEPTGLRKTYGLERTADGLALIMDYIPGMLFNVWLLNIRKLKLADFFSLAIAMADNLELVHKYRVVHRDIRPEKFIISPKTGQIRLIDFDMAESFDGAGNPFAGQEELEQSLPFMSPELTGRMNRIVDYRTDFYSLGVLFYRMLTGEFPFQAKDAMEWVHAHTSKSPLPLHTRFKEVPEKLSDVIMKLLAKMPEDRYQSAYGIKEDLIALQKEWGHYGEIRFTRLGVQDNQGRLRSASTIYGRTHELDTLMKAYERTAEGKSEMMLIAGYSGVGKTELVHRFQKLLPLRNGGIISGKFDQNMRHIPYGGFIQVFQMWVAGILGETDEQLNVWRERMRQMLGDEAQVIIDIIPDFEWLIGKQQSVEITSAVEAERRFYRVFGNFIQVIAEHHRPLVIFLDDLQWADPESIKVFEKIFAVGRISNLFLIGAYRDYELDPNHPLLSAMEATRKAGGCIGQINLKLLDTSLVLQLVADTLQCSVEHCADLSARIYAKTHGNPFFVNQFIQTLYKEKLLVYDREAEMWSWDVERIEAMGITDNVLDLMVRNMMKLSPRSRSMLQLAAAFGRTFEADLFAAVSGQSEQELTEGLREAVQEGFVMYLSFGGYSFLHDRVQEAAYRMGGSEQIRDFHWKIGRMQLQKSGAEGWEDRVFEIANHFNVASNWFASTDEAEQKEVLRVNLAAGKKAKASMAYVSAEQYLTCALVMMQDCYYNDELGIAICKELVECKYWLGKHEEAEALLETILSRLQTAEEKVEFYTIKVRIYTSQSRFQEAIETTAEALRTFGIGWPETDITGAITVEMAEVRQRLEGKSIMELVNAPAMDDPQKLKVLQLYTFILTALYFTRPDVYALVSMKIVNLSLSYGNRGESASGYSTFAVILARDYGDYETAYAFGRLAVDVAEKYGNRHILSTVKFVLAVCISHWRFPAANSISLLHQSYREAQACGNVLYATFSAVMLPVIEFHKGESIDVLYTEAMKHYGFIDRTKNQIINTIKVMLRFVHALQDQSANGPAPNGDQPDEETFMTELLESSEHRSLQFYYCTKALLSFIYGENEAALEAAKASEQLRSTGLGMDYWVHAEDCFTQALILTRMYSSFPLEEQCEIVEKIDILYGKISNWADHSPDNFRHKAQLIEAEWLRLHGRDEAAMRIYDQAIASARACGNVKDEAIANECAALFYESKGLRTITKAYIKEAHQAYSDWGATDKTVKLEKRYPGWLISGGSQGKLKSGSTFAAGASLEILDVMTAVKASQMISEEIRLDKLLDKLLTVVLENAGAERGFLVIRRGEEWIVAADGYVDKSTDRVLVTQPMESMNAPDRPIALVVYAARTKQSVVLDDASHSELFMRDEYMERVQPKSVLCLPVLNQGQLIALLYLENNLITHAFTTDRLKVLGVLASQMAISIENASLYASMESKVKERTAELEQLIQQLKKSEDRYRTIFEHTGTAMAILDETERITLVNSECERLFESNQADMAGRLWSDYIVAEDVQIIVENRAKRLANDPEVPNSKEVHGFSASGRVIDFLLTVGRMEATTSSLVVSLIDISERKRAEETVRNMVYYDSLTQLPNRKLFEERLKQGIASKSDKVNGLAILFLDLDGFKLVNDTFGHDAGDLLLCEVAQRLKAMLDGNQLVSRLGGDEFTILLPDIESDSEARQVVNEIFSAFAARFLINGHSIHLQTSIGISIWPKDGSSSEQLVKRADEAMYRAKRNGKNQFSFYE